MEERTVALLVRLCSIYGEQMLLKQLMKWYETEVNTEDLWEKAERFISKLEEKYQTRIFEFRDRTNQKILRGLILQWKPDFTLEGEPMIVINDFRLGLQGKDNPVVNLELVYDDLETRDEDLEKLTLLKK
jgi:hypothetical protein